MDCFLLCRSTLRTPPIAPINTLRLVPPAEMNGIGIPVGGIEPLNISYCNINLGNKKERFIALILMCILLIFSPPNLYILVHDYKIHLNIKVL